MAAEPTHVSTRSMRKAAPLQEGPFCSTPNAGNLRTEETTKEEETPAVEAPRAKKRKAGGSPELPTALKEVMRISTTPDIGAELIRRASEVTKGECRKKRRGPLLLAQQRW